MYALSPVLVPQGLWVLARVPRSPEAQTTRGSVPAPAGPVAAAEAAVSLLVHGESTAVGVGVRRGEDGLAGQLARLLHARCGMPVRWEVSGRNGARVRGGLRPRRRLPPIEGRHDVIVITLGVNDTLGRTRVRVWRAAMADLVRQAGAHLTPGGRILLAGVPRLDAFPPLPQPMRTLAGRYARHLDGELAELANDSPSVVHVPTPPMVDDHDLAQDRFHPSARGYRRWAEHLAVSL